MQLHVIWSSGLIVYFISLFDQVSSFRSSEFLLIFLSFSYILSIAKKLCLLFCLHILKDFFLSVVSFISCPFCVFVFLSVRTLSVLVSAYASYVLFDGLNTQRFFVFVQQMSLLDFSLFALSLTSCRIPVQWNEKIPKLKTSNYVKYWNNNTEQTSKMLTF